MNPLKKQHLAFIKAHPFEFAVTRHGFSETDVLFIEKYGNWLRALEEGTLPLFTPAQKAFVAEFKSQVKWYECQNAYVALWKRYRTREAKKDVPISVLKGQFNLQENPIGSREAFMAMRSAQLGTINREHRRD